MNQYDLLGGILNVQYSRAFFLQLRCASYKRILSLSRALILTVCKPDQLET